MTTVLHPRARLLLDFWFSDEVVAGQLWFKSNPTFDRKVRDQFSEDYKRAASGEYDGWLNSPPGAVALVIALDQFPRNLFRGTARAFESDGMAQMVAAIAVDRGLDRKLAPQRRLFIYLPFEHAEKAALQETSVALITPLEKDVPGVARYAERHAALIKEFGRFPHRNAVLGRPSTPAELEYLAKTPNEFG